VNRDNEGRVPVRRGEEEPGGEKSSCPKYRTPRLSEYLGGGIRSQPVPKKGQRPEEKTNSSDLGQGEKREGN